jgi:delta 1-pyrroline-5-carboxylate dehydrogenase
VANDLCDSCDDIEEILLDHFRERKALKAEVQRLTELVQAHDAERSTQPYNRVTEVLKELDTAKLQRAVLQAEVEGENGLRANRDAGWALAKARAKELKNARGREHELREQSIKFQAQLAKAEADRDSVTQTLLAERSQAWEELETYKSRSIELAKLLNKTDLSVVKAIHELECANQFGRGSAYIDRALEILRGK